MTPIVQSVTEILSFFTLIGCAGVVFLLTLIIFGKRTSWYSFFEEHSLLFSFIVLLAGMAGSLFYSQFAHFTPCTLCWWQRAFLYPQAFLLGWALWRGYKKVWRFSLPLSVAGLLVAAYQVYLQFGGTVFVLCSAGDALSCAKRYFLAYGFITIPTMSLVAFALLVLFNLFLFSASRRG